MKLHHGAMTLPCRHLFYLMPATLFTALCRYPQALPRHTGKRATDRRVSARGLHAINASEGEETRSWTTRRGRPRARLLCLPGKKISCPAKRFPNAARGGMGAPAFSRAKNRTRRASSAVTSTTFVVTASTCLAFRSGGGGHRQFVQACVGREASNAVLPTITVRPDRCDRDSLLQKLPPHSDPDQPCSERASFGGSLCYPTSR